VFGPPVFFVIGLVAIIKDQSRWAVAGLVVSSVTFVLWLAAILFGGFG
jgi:hypothetical protein